MLCGLLKLRFALLNTVTGHRAHQIYRMNRGTSFHVRTGLHILAALQSTE
jgi:hypothetical protein